MGAVLPDYAAYDAAVFKETGNAGSPRQAGHPPLVAEMAENDFAQGTEVIIKIKNNTADPLTIKSNCPKNPLTVYLQTGEKFEEKSASAKLNCEIAPDITIQPNSESPVSYKYWNYSLLVPPDAIK